MSTSLQIKKIHTLKNILGLEDDLYRDMLASFGVCSSKELTVAEAKILIEILIDKVEAKKCCYKKYDDFKNRADIMATPAQLRKIEAIWKEICNPDSDEIFRKTLRKFIKKQFHIDDVRFMTKAKASIIISVLEKIQVSKCLKAL